MGIFVCSFSGLCLFVSLFGCFVGGFSGFWWWWFWFGFRFVVVWGFFACFVLFFLSLAIWKNSGLTSALFSLVEYSTSIHSTMYIVPLGGPGPRAQGT